MENTIENAKEKVFKTLVKLQTCTCDICQETFGQMMVDYANGFIEQVELHELREKCKKQQELIDTIARTSEKHRKHANEFIMNIADMLNMDTDGLGYDGLTLSLDDFKDAISAFKHEA